MLGLQFSFVSQLLIELVATWFIPAFFSLCLNFKCFSADETLYATKNVFQTIFLGNDYGNFKRFTVI